MKKKLFGFTLVELLLVIVMVGLLAFLSIPRAIAHEISMESKGYLWEGEAVNDWCFISPAPQPDDYAVAIIDGLEASEKNYIVTWTITYMDQEIITVQDSRKLYTALIVLTNIGQCRLSIDLLVKGSRNGLISGLTKFGDSVAEIIVSAVKEIY